MTGLQMGRLGLIPAQARFDPRALFGATGKGLILDPSVTASLYSDTARTTPATLNGAVGGVADQSGKGNHLSQAMAGQQPLWKQASGRNCIRFDGVDDNLAKLAFDLTGTDELTVITSRTYTWAGANEISWSHGNVNASEAGSADAYHRAADGALVTRSRGATATDTSLLTPSGAAGVFTYQRKIGGPYVRSRQNLGAWVTGTVAQGANNNTTRDFYFGSRATILPHAMDLYWALVINRVLTDAELARAIPYAAAKRGVTL